MFFRSDADWTARCKGLADDLLARYAAKGLRPDNFGFVALRENGPGAQPDGFAYRGDWRCYPCSLVKAFHLVHALHAIETGSLLGGNMIVETVFGWPGLGRLVVESIFLRNFPLVQAAVLLYAVTYVLLNFIADILYTVLNPRVKL